MADLAFVVAFVSDGLVFELSLDPQFPRRHQAPNIVFVDGIEFQLLDGKKIFDVEAGRQHPGVSWARPNRLDNRAHAERLDRFGEGDLSRLGRALHVVEEGCAKPALPAAAGKTGRIGAEELGRFPVVVEANYDEMRIDWRDPRTAQLLLPARSVQVPFGSSM